jgi:hypothetical protein
MKNLILAILFFAIMPINTANEIPKKASKIIIHTSQSAEQNYQNLGRYLLSKNYQFNSNKDFYTFSTIEKPVPKLSGSSMIFHLVCTDSLITLTGDLLFLNGTTQNKIMNKGMNGSALKNAFNAMNALAVEYPNNKQIEYVIE